MSCDTISQVKLKILLKRYGPTKSYRPDITDFDLFHLNYKTDKRHLLQDFDNTNYIDTSGWKKYNTLRHYKIQDDNSFLLLHKNAILQTSGTFNDDTLPEPPTVAHEHGLSITSFTLPPPPMFPPTCSLPRKSIGNKSLSGVSGTTTPIYSPESATMPRVKVNGQAHPFVNKIDSVISSKHQSTISMNKSDGNVLGISGYLKESTIRDESRREERVYHLIKKNEGLEGLEKAAVERFFHSIFSTKQKVQPETNSLLEKILCISDAPIEVPLCTKFLFAFYDEIALNYKLDEETIHIWKSNSLILRFWMDVIQEPTRLLDVDDLPSVQSSMKVISTALMEACSTSNYDYHDHTPLNKLLYAKELKSKWNDWIRKFYKNTQEQTSNELEKGILNFSESLQNFREMMLCYEPEFNRSAACAEILPFALKYKNEILEELIKIEDEHKEYRLHCFNNIVLAGEREQVNSVKTEHRKFGFSLDRKGRY